MIKNIKKIFKVLIYYISCLSIRNKRKVIYGAWFGNKFADNSKYLYRMAIKDKELRNIWITKSEKVYKEMKEFGYEVYMSKSLKAIFHQLTAGIYFTCTGKEDVDYYLLGSAKHVELWHGVPLKKIMYDDKYNQSIDTRESQLKTVLKNRMKQKEYVIATSKKIKEIYINAFRLESERILNLGQPRNDVFFNDDIEDINFSKEFKNKKVILYMPTHRNEGKTRLKITEIMDLPKLNKICKENDYIFLIKKHYYHIDEEENIDQYENIIDITKEIYDSQLLLKYAEILITDYSSCYIDYLLLNRPIIFYNFDYKNYIMNDREMYFEYSKVTPGEKVINYLELEHEILNLISKKDIYKEERERVKSIFYSIENQRSVSVNLLNTLI